MNIRHATLADMEQLLPLFANARRFMADNGNAGQWWGGYPTPPMLEEDIALGRSYVCEEDGHIYASFVLMGGEEPTYQVIEGAWKNDLPYGTLHRIASSGEKRGMMDMIVDWAFQQYGNLKGDTHEKNLPMQKAFERNGFERCGIIHVADGSPRIAYQKTGGSKLPKLICIVGTNASGKSDLGVKLAKKYGGEIVSADSRQVFRRLDLGSGKITPEEMQGVPHHLLDICDPGEFFSMADFQRLAYEAIDDIIARGKPAFLVGGTGLYVDAVADGYVLSNKMPDLAYRAKLEEMSTEALYRTLIEQRPDCDVERRNRNRVMRLLEKLHDGDDVTPSKAPRYEVLRLGVTWPREILCERIDQRMTRRFAEGMLEEVQTLLNEGVSPTFMLKLGLEYRIITQYLTGVIDTREELENLLGTSIKQFAKRQMTWFRRNPDIKWLDMAADPVEQASELIDAFLKTNN